MTGMGLPALGDFSTAKIFAGVIFSGIGFAIFIYGKKNRSIRPLVIGVALMGYPYFVASTALLYLIGIALIAALYFWQE